MNLSSYQQELVIVKLKLDRKKQGWYRVLYLHQHGDVNEFVFAEIIQRKGVEGQEEKQRTQGPLRILREDAGEGLDNPVKMQLEKAEETQEKKLLQTLAEEKISKQEPWS